jgi:two-component system phosphate regulon response regulator PhoB
MTSPAKPKILVVEDDADTVEALRVLFENEGYEVLTASDATSAFELNQAEKPDLIVLDIMMPSGTEGFHFVWRLRREGDEACRDVPIIVVSAVHDTFPLKLYPDQSDPVYAPHEYLPVQAFLDKPAEPSQLLAEVRRLLKSPGDASGD